MSQTLTTDTETSDRQLTDLLAADTVLRGGRVVTFDDVGSVHEAVALHGGRVLAVGSDAEIAQLVGRRTTVVELGGRTVLPGLMDCHMHLATDAAVASQIDVRDIFTGISSIPEILEAMVARAKETPPGDWVIARGSPIQELRLAEKRRITRHDLDAVLPDHPAYVTFGAHITQANSRALALRGITRDTPDPAGGTIEHDAEGEPSGVLKERAQYLLRPRRAEIGLDELERNIVTLLEGCRRRGATMIHDIVASRDELLAYVNLARSGRLPIRVQLIVRVIESTFDKESLLDLGIIDGLGDDMLRIGGVKMSIDGGTTGRNGAFSEPLIGEPDNAGIIRIDQDELDDTVLRYHRMGMRVCLHAVGDVAHRMALSSIEKALADLPRTDHRHRIEHLGNWLFTPEELEWAKRLDVIPMPNPTGLRHVADVYAPLLGPERMQYSYRFGTVLRAGFRSSFASDGPGGYPCDPLRDAGTLVSRRSVNGVVHGVEEAVTVDEALRAQTVNAAYVGFVEDRLGSLEPGKLADLVVLGRDPWTTPPEDFIDIPVDLTAIGGELIDHTTQSA